MGVKGLFYLVEKCPDACKDVSIKEMADNHRYLFNCQPVLVVDGSNLMPRLYEKGNLECIYGGQWLQFEMLVKNFVRQCESIGVKLVFIFDGTISELKREEWIKRRMQKCEEIAKFFDGIHRKEHSVSYEHPPIHLGIFARFILKELGAEVYQTDREVDPDNFIARYAHKNQEVFAVLSQDSDFLIYPTKPLLSASHLDMSTMRTVQYNRECFAEQYLGIKVKQLPLFACLLGNDFVSFENLKRFHQSLVRYGRRDKSIIAESLCKLIKSERWTGDLDNWQELNRISCKVFNDIDGADIINDGLKFYAIRYSAPRLTVCMQVHPKLKKVIHEKHFNCKTTCLFNLFCKKEFGSNEVLEHGVVSPSALAYREIRQRCYGVLFNCFCKQDNPAANADSIQIKERCVYEGNDLKEPELIKPLPLESYSSAGTEYQSPRIEDIWFNFTLEKKLWLFWRILQVPMSFDVLMALPEEQIVLTCILNYLIRGSKSGPLLQPIEVAVFVAQTLWKTDPNILERLQKPPVRAAAINLSTLFISGVFAVLMAFETCDSPFPVKYVMPWHFFDGKLFHYLYDKAKRNATVHELCKGEDEIIEEFYKLLAAATDHTVYAVDRFNWRNILKDYNN